MCVHCLCYFPSPSHIQAERVCPLLRFCCRENIGDNKKDIAFLLVWDKDSYTERFLALQETFLIWWLKITSTTLITIAVIIWMGVLWRRHIYIGETADCLTLADYNFVIVERWILADQEPKLFKSPLYQSLISNLSLWPNTILSTR
jgi:hypothetical protein